MFLKTGYFIGNLPVAIVLRDRTRQILYDTCFRGVDKRLAGNFLAFKSCWDIFGINSHWFTEFLLDINETYHRGEKTGVYSFDCGQVVGWSGTDHFRDYEDVDLEWFNPNDHCRALQVKTDRLDLFAPLTSKVTIEYQINPEKDKVVVIIRSIYPGNDVGELDGDVTRRELYVFFDRNHPGEPL